jgi:Predicted phosphohydrolases
MNKTFLHISDTHYRARYPSSAAGYLSLFSSMTSPLEQIDICLKAAATDNLDFVILSGDLTEGGNAEDYASLRAHLKKRLGDIPLIVTLGNHDVKAAFYEGWLKKSGQAEPYNEVVTVSPLRIITLDNSVEGLSDGRVDAAQCTWLQKTLDEIGGEPSILVTHHHLLANQHQIPCAEVAPAFEGIIANSGILGVFCGHTHHNYAGTYAGKPYYTADSLSFAGSRVSSGTIAFSECSGASLFTLSETGFTLQRIPVLPQGRVLAQVPITKGELYQS